MHRAVDLTTGPEPDWESQGGASDVTALKGIPESLVVLQSLRQSRSKWITSMFPKFSSRGRGTKVPEVTPPPHTIKAHGKYDLTIGPHVFSGTAIYEVHYLLEADPSATLGPAVQSTQGSALTYPGTTGSQASTPLVNVPSISYVTPALSSQVAIASQSNPILANLLNAVINRTATDDQVKTLGLLIQSLEGVQQLGNTQPPSTVPPTSTRSGSPKPFDIILEFHERPTDRWIFPRGDVVCERVGVADGVFARSADVIVTASLPFDGMASIDPALASDEQVESQPPEVASFHFSRVPQQLWDMFLVWAGGPTKIEQSRTALAELVKKAPPRSYLQHRLPEGELLSEIQAAVAPSYTMKSIKPAGADSTRAKRKSVSRKATLVSDGLSSPSEKVAPAKRRQSLKGKAPAPPPIACRACGQMDVPLMMGGRYCRICIDAGKAIADVPQLTPRSGSSSNFSASMLSPSVPVSHPLTNTSPIPTTPSPTTAPVPPTAAEVAANEIAGSLSIVPPPER
ncbi:hypothetical protein L227DRAFT_579360 [Lentinus tigrinus ALCF2SS1-6]|uniref:Uncharacterized protein n=1 Tax=Lentinus tigrinus ALCF2SS1-6 TaxID=1328759 RepID=A0A5C2RXU8_9APHY|nr:hypothetical protein L227DRAFT_579360 [Lentinus tigrinus ALCF2SS1-6]